MSLQQLRSKPPVGTEVTHDLERSRKAPGGRTARRVRKWVARRAGRRWAGAWIVAGVCLAGVEARGQTWDGGGGTDSNWTTGANWATNFVPLNNGTAALVFTGSAGLTPNANVDWSLLSISFTPPTSGTASSFTVDGAEGTQLTFSSGGIISNTTTVTQTLNNNLNLVANESGLSLSASSGALTLAATLNLGAGAGAPLTIDGAGATNLNGVVSGTGGRLIKNGAGTLTLTGVNTYTGGTTLNAGTLSLGANAGAGSGTLVINGGSLQAATAARTMTNAVTINGDFSVTGTQALTLAGNMALTADRTVTVNSTGVTTFSGDLSGSGRLTKAGSGVLVLSGDNTYTGGTTLNAGTLGFGADDALPGALVINGGNIQANGAGRTIDAAVTVNGDFGVTGSASLTLTSGFVLDTTRTVTVSNTGETIFSGAISGMGGLTKLGTGSLELSAQNTYTGSTTVTAGALIVSGAIPGDVLVNSEGTLAGVSIGGNVTTAGTGTLNAGGLNAVGTMTIGGNLTLSDTATTQVDVASTTSVDRYEVTGAAALDGTLRIIFLTNPPSMVNNNDEFTVLAAEGGVTDAFSSVTTSSASIRAQAEVTGNSVVVTLQDVPFVNSALGDNQRTVAGLLESRRESATGDLATVINQAELLNLGELRNVLDQMAPEELVAMTQASFAAMAGHGDDLSGRMAAARAGVVGPFSQNLNIQNVQLASLGNDPQATLRLMALASEDGDVEQEGQTLDGSGDDGAGVTEAGAPYGVGRGVYRERNWSFFAAGAGTFGSVDGSSGVSGYDFVAGRITIGADRRLGKNALVGAMLGYDRSNVESDGSGGEVDADSIRFGFYGSYAQDVQGQPFFVNGYVGAAYHLYETTRDISLGASPRTATADPDGVEFDAMFEAGMEVPIKEIDWNFYPVVSVLYSWLFIDGYSESGAGSLNLFVDGQTNRSLVTRIGARLSKSFVLTDVTLIPRFGAMYQHDTYDQTDTLTATFAAGGFAFETPGVGHESAVLSAAVSVLPHDSRHAFFFDYTAEVGRTNYLAHNVRVGWQVQF